MGTLRSNEGGVRWYCWDTHLSPSGFVYQAASVYSYSGGRGGGSGTLLSGRGSELWYVERRARMDSTRYNQEPRIMDGWATRRCYTRLEGIIGSGRVDGVMETIFSFIYCLIRAAREGRVCAAAFSCFTCCNRNQLIRILRSTIRV